jgi:hypothetical protein
MRDPENLIGQAVKKIISNIGKKVSLLDQSLRYWKEVLLT